jgi:hypothetical protein
MRRAANVGFHEPEGGCDWGAGSRPSNPWEAIMWAAARGQGLRLTAEDVWTLSGDDAIATAASASRFQKDDE